jgi:hypothetical protein
LKKLSLQEFLSAYCTANARIGIHYSRYGMPLHYNISNSVRYSKQVDCVLILRQYVVCFIDLDACDQLFLIMFKWTVSQLFQLTDMLIKHCEQGFGPMKVGSNLKSISIT